MGYFKKSALFIILSILSINLYASDKAEIGKPAPDFELTGSDGLGYYLSNYAGKFVVLEWINFECPFVKKHYESKNMQTLQKKYTDKDVIWLSINSSAPGKQGFLPPYKITQKAKELESHATGYLIDSSGKVGKMYGAKTTPHMFIIDPEGILIYAGGIDDIASTDIDDIEKAKNYVEEALDLVLDGKPIETKTSKPYGCSVKY